MRRQGATIAAGFAILLAAAAGCYSGETPNKTPSGSSPTTTESAPTDPSSSSEPKADLPCEIAAIVSSTCGSCHGPTLAEDAKIHLVSRSDFAKALEADPSRSVADLCVARMQDEAKPMPPNAPAASDALATFQQWIADGMPEGTCSVQSIDYATDTVCTSNKKWTRGDHGDQLMHPGRECISCHKQSGERDAVIYTVAGTVFPTAHEPDDCNGLSGTSASKPKVIITDAKGVSVTLTPNAAGNFYTDKALTKPLHAKVQAGDKFYEMGGEIKDGDCNGCHTEGGRADEGAEYPRGRIVAP